MKWELESELALRASSSAGALLTSSSGLSFIEKENHKDIVTEFDVAAGRVIEGVLAENSKYAIVNEENISTYSSSDQSIFWVIDPIDGTSNFASGMNYFCTSVGLISDKDFVVGSIYAPKNRELYFTYGDQGSFLNGKAIQSHKSIDLKQSIVAASFSNSSNDSMFLQNQYVVFGEVNNASRSLLRLGSAALNLAYVSDGRLQGAYGLKAKIWDVGAGLALAKQAGAMVYVEHVDFIHVNYVVGSKNVVEQILQILQKKELINVT